MECPKVVVRGRKIANVRAGEYWIYPNAIVSGPEEATFAQFLNESDQHVGWGDYNPHAPVRGRLLSMDEDWPGDEMWLAQMLQYSINRRLRLHYPIQAGALRLVNAEGDGIPGLIIDCYAATMVIDLYSVGMRDRLPVIQNVIRSMLPDCKQVVRMGADAARREHADPIQPDTGRLRFNENGLSFEVDLSTSQKSGFFLDQRENRRAVMLYAQQRRVLDLFCYHGGFGMHAVAGGAREVWFVDSSAQAMAATKENIERNDLGGVLVEEDVFRFLDALDLDEHFDLIICDPPKLAPSKKDRTKALRAYRVLINRCLRHLNPGGVLMVASCSQIIDAEELLKLLKQINRKIPGNLDVLSVTGQPSDHPWPIGFAGGRYLSAVFVEYRL